MNTIGNRIKLLRKAKGATQEEMGLALGHSYQAISKWENDSALPDVEMIPKIAEYFGITIDELFGYKLNALTNKERFIQFMQNNQILCLEDCELKHGGSAKYFVNTENFNTNSQIAKIGEYFADCIRENHLEFDTLIGLAYTFASLGLHSGNYLSRRFRDLCITASHFPPPRQHRFLTSTA